MGHAHEYCIYIGNSGVVMVSRVVSGAHYGLRDWLMQRITAVIMAVFSVFLAGFFVLHTPLQFGDLKQLFSHDPMRYFTLLFFLSLFLHAWVGMRDILMDYVHSAVVRLALHSAVIVSLVIYFMWAVQIIWGK